jgi:hypothetical protein
MDRPWRLMEAAVLDRIDAVNVHGTRIAVN